MKLGSKLLLINTKGHTQKDATPRVGLTEERGVSPDVITALPSPCLLFAGIGVEVYVGRIDSSRDSHFRQIQ